MKILHLVDEPWDSGIVAYVLQIATLLKSDGHETILGVRSGKTPEKLARSAGLTTVAINSLGGLVRFLSRQKVDVINAHTGRTHSWSVLARLGCAIPARKLPIVRTRGDARPLKTHLLVCYVYRKTAGVIAASQHVREQYDLEFPFLKERIHTIYPSVEPDKDIAPLPGETIGILGRLDPVKGHAIFLEAAATLLKVRPDVTFLIAGREANLSYQLLQNQVDQLGITKAVQFLGFQPSARDFMRRCTIGVIASIGSEEVSRACLEWMAVGRPVVGTLVGCLPELIEPDETGYLVPPNDSEMMKQALLKLLEKPDEAAQLGRHANTVIAQRFSPHVMLGKTVDFYRTLLR